MHALVREDGLTQVEAAELLGRHKSWVCRRLALLETAGTKRRGTSCGWACWRRRRRGRWCGCPRATRSKCWPVRRREGLTDGRAGGVVDLLAARGQPAAGGVRAGQAAAGAGPGQAGPLQGADPRLSPARQPRRAAAGAAAGQLARMENWLAQRGPRRADRRRPRLLAARLRAAGARRAARGRSGRRPGTRS